MRNMTILIGLKNDHRSFDNTARGTSEGIRRLTELVIEAAKTDRRQFLSRLGQVHERLKTTTS